MDKRANLATHMPEVPIFYKFLLTLEQAPKHLFNNVLSTCCLVGLKLLSLSQELQDIIKSLGGTIVSTNNKPQTG